MPENSRYTPLVIAASDRSLMGCICGTISDKALSFASSPSSCLAFTLFGNLSRLVWSRTPLINGKTTALSGKTAEMSCASDTADTVLASCRSIFCNPARRVKRHCSARWSGQPVFCHRCWANARTPVSPVTSSKLGCIINTRIACLLNL